MGDIRHSSVTFQRLLKLEFNTVFVSIAYVTSGSVRLNYKHSVQIRNDAAHTYYNDVITCIKRN